MLDICEVFGVCFTALVNSILMSRRGPVRPPAKGSVLVVLISHKKERIRFATMRTTVAAAVACTLAVCAFFLGIFDRPTFEFHDSLVGGRELYAIVAASTDKNFGQNIFRLFNGTLTGINAFRDGPAMLQSAAELYGSPEGADKLAVGLYFDDTARSGSPRWAIGWAVEANFGAVKRAAKTAQKESGLKEPLRAVRISKDNILKAKIPWRTPVTPAIAPMLHWGRGKKAYKEGGYTSSSGRTGEDGFVCLELYVTGANDTAAYLDYALLMGDTRKTWDDTFPRKATS